MNKWQQFRLPLLDNVIFMHSHLHDGTDGGKKMGSALGKHIHNKAYWHIFPGKMRKYNNVSKETMKSRPRYIVSANTYDKKVKKKWVFD